MSNKKKPTRPWLRLVGDAGLTGPKVDGRGVLTQLDIPLDEKILHKEVPAKVDGVVVGTAQIYEDGSVSFIIDENAPQWAKDKIHSETNVAGYSVGTDG